MHKQCYTSIMRFLKNAPEIRYSISRAFFFAIFIHTILFIHTVLLTAAPAARDSPSLHHSRSILFFSTSSPSGMLTIRILPSMVTGSSTPFSLWLSI